MSARWISTIHLAVATASFQACRSLTSCNVVGTELLGSRNETSCSLQSVTARMPSEWNAKDLSASLPGLCLGAPGQTKYSFVEPSNSARTKRQDSIPIGSAMQSGNRVTALGAPINTIFSATAPPGMIPSVERRKLNAELRDGRHS